MTGNKILVVEDDPNLLSTLKYNLEQEGYDVTTAADGVKAVETARWEKPELIILDVMLPEMNGFEVKDLGVDVPKANFVKAIEEFQPDIVGISGLLTNVFDDIRDTIKTIEDSGLREGRKIIIGGGQMDESVREHTHADKYTTDAGVGVQQCLNWMGGK